jgi:hypothetical protein
LPAVSSDEEHVPWLVIDRKVTADIFRETISPANFDDGNLSSADTWQPERRAAFDLILIYGYRPEEDLHEWFTRQFLAGADDTARTRLVVVAGSAGDVTALEPLSYAKVMVGPLQRDAVLAELHTIDEAISDRLEDREFDLYSDGIATDPSLLGALRHVLPLTSAVVPEHNEPEGE